jgi:hypothetical protein
MTYRQVKALPHFDASSAGQGPEGSFSPVGAAPPAFRVIAKQPCFNPAGEC